MTYATATDVTNRYPRALSPEETTLVNTRLADAEREIRRKIPDLDDKIDDGTIDVEDVKEVEAEAVLRILKNPEGYVSETDGSYTYMLAQELASGVLEITPAEWKKLGVIIRRGMFFIDPDPVIAV
ncbi:Gp19/Gp15/Gp42 family protein [Nocardia sp. NPDC001965]